jgi:hypothetical protein
MMTIANLEYQATTVEFGLDSELRLSVQMHIVCAAESGSFSLSKSCMMQRTTYAALAFLRRIMHQIQCLSKRFIC